MNSDQPNILLLTIDSLRADHCGFLNQDSDLTPNLDSLAEESVVFEHAIAPGPRTPSSMPEIFTGEVFGPVPPVDDWSYDERKHRISKHLARYRTVTEHLHANGYNTGGVTANPWTQYLPKTTFELGFDTYKEIDGTDLFEGDTSHVSNWLSLTDKLLDISGIGERYGWRWKKDWFIQWPHIYDHISAQFQQVSNPSFYWFFLLDPHEPYLSPRQYREENSALEMYYAVLKDSLDSGEGDGMSDGDKKRLRRAYRDAVRSIDKFVGKILEDCSDDTIVVFHSDHGEAFGEHGTWGHKSQLYRENLHVPFLVSGMGSESVRDPVSLRKIPEIIMEIANKPQNFNPDEYTNRFVYSTTERGDKTSLSGTDWKFIIDSDTAELYSLTDDPHEQTNISNNSGNIVRLFEQLARTRQTRANEKTAIAKATDAVRKI